MGDRDLPMRAAVLRGLTALVDEAGGSGREFLETYGVDESLIERPEGFIGVRLVERLLEDAASRFELPDLGLRMAGRQDPRILGPLAIAMENSPTIGEALECADRFLFVLSPALAQDVIPDPLGNAAVVGIRQTNTLGITSAQFVDYGLGMEHRVVTLVNGGAHYGLRSLQLPHPPVAPESVYRDHFGAEVAFNSADAVLRVPRQLLGVPVDGSSGLLREIALNYLESRFDHRSGPMAELVLGILKGQPGPDRPDLASVARLLSLHPRSLQRLLADEDVTFKELLDHARRDQALHLITNTDLAFARVAALVGLREQSSLSHAVQRWFGVSPSRLRGSARGK